MTRSVASTGIINGPQPLNPTRVAPFFCLTLFTIFVVELTLTTPASGSTRYLVDEVTSGCGPIWATAGKAVRARSAARPVLAARGRVRLVIVKAPS